VLARLREEAAPYIWDAEPNELQKKLAARRSRGFSVNLNYLGEEVLGYTEARARLRAYAAYVRRGDIDAVSIKLTGIEPHLELLDLEQTVERVFQMVMEICDSATQRPGGPPVLYFDMEAYEHLAVSERLLVKLLDEAPLEVPFGLAVQ